jgi:4-hydroxybenzoate polyprenyltransferase
MASPALNRLIQHNLRFWIAYTVQIRPYLAFGAGLSALAGMAVAKAVNPDFSNQILAFITLLLSYGFGMALEDCFQMDTDKESGSGRPLSKGIIPVRSVMMASISGLLACAVVLYYLNPMSLFLSVLFFVGIYTYSFMKKRGGIRGVLHNSITLSLFPVIGYFTALPHQEYTIHQNLWIVVAIVFLSYSNFSIMGHLKDIEADTKTGYQTFAVKYGWNPTVMMGSVFATLVLVTFWVTYSGELYELIFGLIASCLLVYAQYSSLADKKHSERNAVVVTSYLLRAFVLMCAAIAMRFHPEWLVKLIILYTAFELSLYIRPSKFKM